MLRTIIDNLTKRVEELETKYACKSLIIEGVEDYILQTTRSVEELTARLDNLHAISDKPIVITKPKPSHVIGKLRKGNKND